MGGKKNQLEKEMIKINTKVLHKTSYGLHLITSCKGDSINGQTANAVMQIYLGPTNHLHQYQPAKPDSRIYKKKQGLWRLNPFPGYPLNFIGKFGFKSGRSIDKFENIGFALFAEQARNSLKR